MLSSLAAQTRTLSIRALIVKSARNLYIARAISFMIAKMPTQLLLPTEKACVRNNKRKISPQILSYNIAINS